MNKKWLHIAVILMFSCVPMVQLVTADTFTQKSSGWFGGDITSLGSRVTASDIFDSIKKDRTYPTDGYAFPWFPSSSRDYVRPTPQPTPVPPDASIAPVYISNLDLTAEYVKLTNQQMTRVSMTGWKITNSKGKSIRFIDWINPDGSTYTFTLRPRGTVTIYSDKSGTPTSTRLYWPQEMWNDNGDTANLYDPEGNLVSTMTR